MKNEKNLRIVCAGRQTGKTTECREFLKKHKDAIAIAPTKQQASGIHEKRAFIPEEIMINGINKCKSVCIDEADFISRRLVYAIIKYCDNVLITGTPKIYRTEQDGEKSIFEHLYNDFPENFWRKTMIRAKEEQEFWKNTHPDLFKSEFEARFKSD